MPDENRPALKRAIGLPHATALVVGSIAGASIHEAFRRCREHLSEPPSRTLARSYYDTVNFDPNALRLALDFAGADRLLAGSDYPHMIGSLDKMKTSIRALELPLQDEAKILGGNAVRLLGGTAS